MAGIHYRKRKHFSTKKINKGYQWLFRYIQRKQQSRKANNFITPIIHQAMQTLTLPYINQGLNKIYQLLFCDQPQLFTDGANQHVYPWNILLSPAPSVQELRNISEDTSMGARLQLLAYYLLRKGGSPVPAKQLLGVVVEVGMEGGLDTLAAYGDGTARYIHYTGRLIVWDTTTPASDKLIQELFEHSKGIVSQIGPWHKNRLGPPPVHAMRLNFLASDGLYFGQSPMEDLSRDPLAAPVVQAATQLLIFLTERHLN